MGTADYPTSKSDFSVSPPEISNTEAVSSLSWHALTESKSPSPTTTLQPMFTQQAEFSFLCQVQKIKQAHSTAANPSDPSSLTSQLLSYGSCYALPDSRRSRYGPEPVSADSRAEAVLYLASLVVINMGLGIAKRVSYSKREGKL